MKKIVVSILAVFYLCSSTGATVHLHYCMDKVVNWDLFDKTGDKCGKCGMKKDGHCCKDEVKFVKNIADQKVAESAIQLIQMVAVAAPAVFNYTSEQYFSSLTQEYPKSHEPSRDNGVGIYILNRVFRI